MSASETTRILVDFSAHRFATKSSRLCERKVDIRVTAMVAYFGVLLWRSVGLFLFSIHATGCLIREKHASFRCENFTLFSHANELQVAWQMSSVINALVAIAVLLNVPGYRGYLSALRNNSKYARFWSLFFQMFVMVTFKIVLISTEPPDQLGVNKLIEAGYIFMDTFTLLVAYLWNGVPAPWKTSGVVISRVAHAAYVCSLLVFILENFVLFVIISAQAAFQVTGLYNSHEFFSALQVISVMQNAVEASLNYALLTFFWNKWFYCERNLLMFHNI